MPSVRQVARVKLSTYPIARRSGNPSHQKWSPLNGSLSEFSLLKVVFVKAQSGLRQMGLRRISLYRTYRRQNGLRRNSLGAIGFKKKKTPSAQKAEGKESPIVRKAEGREVLRCKTPRAL